jgi:hypothetical protein
METFSIEMAAEKIDDSRTKTYFREVYSSYANGNYRSATVMLWTVTICDLLYKLQNLRDMYGDPIAQAILDDIAHLQKQNPNSPEWESELLKTVKERTELLDNAEYHSISSLKNYRHLSAHPVLGTADLLYSPNKDTVRSLIRNVLEAVLVKPPILSKKIFSELIIDLTSKKELLPDDISLKRYLDAKYLKNLKPAIENYIFRSLWKFAFSLSNEDANENREINARALRVIYNRRANEFKETIKSEVGYYSNVNPGEPLRCLIEFISENPSLYEILNDNARILIKNITEDDLNLFAISTFLSDSVTEHLEQVMKLIDGKDDFDSWELLSQPAWNKIFELCKENDKELVAIRIAIQSFIKSSSYAAADTSFMRFITPCRELFTKEHLLEILDGIEQNNQIFGRRKASTDHNNLKKKCDKVLGSDFDYTPYPRFLASIGKDFIEKSA